MIEQSVADHEHSQGEKLQRPFETITAAFYSHTLRHPMEDAIIDISGGSEHILTYRSLAANAQKLAATLLELGVGPGQRVPIITNRSGEMVVGILAILSCGAQYVPLDGGVVADSTIQRVAEQCCPRILLCSPASETRAKTLLPNVKSIILNKPQDVGKDLSEHVDPNTWIDLAAADDGCYVIYTSGTTGLAKGVDVTHKNVVNLVSLAPGNLGVAPGVRVGQVLNISFDMAAWEIFACLCNGGTLVIRGSDWERTLNQINVLICTPTILSRYQPVDYPNIHTIATAGEPTSQSLADLWAAHATYWNCCGPTETTIVNTMSRHLVGDPVSIGRPTPNNAVYILDSDMQPVAPGCTGMMWAGGLGVTRGYVQLLSQTRAAYVPDHFAVDGSNMYCTGDLGKWREDGKIDIVGRVDDQVKVKGFRVELDGVSASLSSAPAAGRATTLFIDGTLHGFVIAPRGSEQTIRAHMAKVQPYYAIPSFIHILERFPLTPNGKIDKMLLRQSVLHIQEKQLTAPGHDIQEISSTSAESFSEKTDSVTIITAAIPPENAPRYIRQIRHRLFIVYRFLFSAVALLNIAALVVVLLTGAGSAKWPGIIVSINLVLAVIIRQDDVINVLYSLVCSVPRTAPMWLRRRCAKIYHLGGTHSGAAFCATAWLIGTTIRSTIAYIRGFAYDMSLASLVLSWFLTIATSALVIFAWPGFRQARHNTFELIHRLGGWTVLALFWVQLLVSARDASHAIKDIQFGAALIAMPNFWLLCIATCSIASSWLRLRSVQVNAEPLSDHAILLCFDYTIPVNGTFTRLSRRPLLEWHSFATIPLPESTTLATIPGYSLVVSNAGDWTKDCIQNPPTRLWVRGAPTCGVMRIATLFNRVVLIATGSGIGPCLGHIANPSCPTQLIWSAPDAEKTFGANIIGMIHQSIPNAIIHNTRLQGRPDLVKMSFNMAKSFQAEAVIIIANQKITKQVVLGLETRGIPAYGAIWDS